MGKESLRREGIWAVLWEVGQKARGRPWALGACPQANLLLKPFLSPHHSLAAAVPVEQMRN